MTKHFTLHVMHNLEHSPYDWSSTNCAKGNHRLIRQLQDRCAGASLTWIGGHATMVYDRWDVRKIKGFDPEVFCIVSLNSAMTNPFMETSDGLSETELRAELKKRGVAESNIESLIVDARSKS